MGQTNPEIITHILSTGEFLKLLEESKYEELFPYLDSSNIQIREKIEKIKKRKKELLDSLSKKRGVLLENKDLSSLKEFRKREKGLARKVLTQEEKEILQLEREIESILLPTENILVLEKPDYSILGKQFQIEFIDSKNGSKINSNLNMTNKFFNGSLFMPYRDVRGSVIQNGINFFNGSGIYNQSFQLSNRVIQTGLISLDLIQDFQRISYKGKHSGKYLIALDQSKIRINRYLSQNNSIIEGDFKQNSSYVGEKTFQNKMKIEGDFMEENFFSKEIESKKNRIKGKHEKSYF